MAAKSDFAQKLLHDLRVRKERMAATQNSKPRPRQTPRAETQGNPGQTYRGGRQINGYDSSRTGNSTRRSAGHTKAISTAESSNQIVLYNGGNNSKQVKDLSMAIAFAFENGGKLSKIGTSSSNPLVNFFHRFSQGSRESGNMGITSFSKNNYSTYQFPTVSHVHISEIAKGVQNINQILRACSDGLDFDGNSIEIGKELLKGAINLEESLRMLVNLQEASKYTNGNQKKNRIRLLEDDDEDQDNSDTTAKQKQLDRPKFSFDKPTRNSPSAQRATKNDTQLHLLALSYLDEAAKRPVCDSKMVPHKRSVSCVPNFDSHSTQVKQRINSSSPHPAQEKGRISNVVAKLMGLEELPRQDNPTCAQKELSIKPKERMKRTGKFRAETQSCLIHSMETARMAQSSEPTRLHHRAKPKIFRKEERKISGTRESHVLLLDNKPHQKAQQNGLFFKDDDITGETIEFNARSNHLEKKDVKKDLPSNLRNPQDKRTSFQTPESKKPETSEDKHQEVQKEHSFIEQNLIAKKYKGCEEESITSSKTNQGSANMHKKQSHHKTTPVNGISARLVEKVSSKDPPNNTYQNDPPIVENHNSAANQEVIKKEDQSHYLSSSEPRCDQAQASNSTPMCTQEEPVAASATQKKGNSKKLQKSKNPQKIEVMTKRNDNVSGLPRSMKKSATLLQDLKQHLQNKSSSTGKSEKQMGAQVREGKVDTMMHGQSEMKTEPSNQLRKLPKEADQMTALSCLGEEDCQKENTLTLMSGTSDGLASKSQKVFNDQHKVEQLGTFRDEEAIKQCDQSLDDLKESTDIKDLSQLNYKQFSESWRQEQLTEDEKNLKEILIKSQLFLNAAEALFKLNIPFSFLHAGDPSGEVANKRLVLDCGYEVMNRKARRYQVTHHPYTNTTVKRATPRSLDDLVKILCRDIEVLKLYGRGRAGEADVAGYLCNMLNKDIHNEEPDVNSTWDFEWNKMMYMFPEKEDVVKDVEKYMLNGLLDEISSELLLVTV
ncbi:uncharacterized protein [Primulina eburnea]|uniref:uncharacterized protein n=1 Tax=Primulina eburnea TaxID=1245227 RepID=UPI003C6C97F1